MNTHSVFLGTLVLGSMVVVAFAQEKTKVYDTPEAVFKAAQTAASKKDFKSFFSCITEDSQKLMTGQLVMTGSLIKASAGRDPTGKATEMIKPINEVFSKHGVTDEALKKIKPPKSPEEAAKTVRTVAGLVKSPAAFCSELIAVLDKMNPKGGNDPFATGKLSDVKITGNKARGTIQMKVGESERKEPIEFAKVGGGWKLVMPEPKAPGGAKLPPPAKEPKDRY
jgi:hypothetical protein